MPSYPNTIKEFREKANKSGVVFDPTKSTVFFVEDLDQIEEEIVSIEKTIGTNFKKSFSKEILKSEERLKKTYSEIDFDNIESLKYIKNSLNIKYFDNSATGFVINSDFSKIYICGDSTNKIYQFSLEVPGDIETLKYDNKFFDISSFSTYPGGIWVNPEESLIFFLDTASKLLFKLSLSTPGDISTASLVGSGLDVSNGGHNIGDIFFLSDGYSFLTTDLNDLKMYRWNLTTAFDITTATITSDFLDFSSVVSVPLFFTFNSSGKTLFVLDPNSEEIIIYSLSTAFDITTAIYTGFKYNKYGYGTYAVQIKCSPFDDCIYVIDTGTDQILEFQINDFYHETIFSFPDSFNGKYIRGGGVYVNKKGSGTVDKTIFDLQKRSINDDVAGEWTSTLTTLLTLDPGIYDSRDSAIPPVMDNDFRVINPKDQYRLVVKELSSKDIYGLNVWIEVSTT